MDKEKKAIERLKLASNMSLQYYEKPLIVTTSGGKDSDVCIRLALNAGIPFEVQHNLTTADAPETVYHVRNTFKRLENKGIKCSFNYPTYKGKRATMWNLIPQKLLPPTRIMRYCCSVLKEQSGKDRMITTGVRWDESVRRKNTRATYELFANKIENKILLNDNDDTRRLFENCQLKAKRIVNPVIDWTNRDIWNYIHSENIPMNPLYSCGFDRVGCIGCPMAGKKRNLEFAKYPKYKENYIKAFDRMLEERKIRGKKTKWKTGQEVFDRWIEKDVDIMEGQLNLFEEE
ncbi:MAG TPA: phosphoadenosine phosphosulfate reductase family protein [Candidatus Fimicola cottocaccae]|nr:phosphoadenosine phosphosulfate reductase family protein [Candidatus Fimicola cottocaccae]